MAASRLEFRVLGPLVVRVDGAVVPVGGPKQRALLALLLLSANRVVSRDRLIEELFADQSVNSADHALRNHVSRLRKALAPVAADEPRLVARTPGYLLRVEPGELDLERFEQLVGEGREALAADDAGAAAASLHAAAALWNGRPLADLEFEPFAQVEVERIEELRLAALEQRIDADLALGRHLALVPELEALGVEHRFRERFRAQLMLALYRSGRQADGLAVYRRTRELLNEELGLEPGIELQQLERSILTQAPELTIAGRGRATGRGARREVCPFKGLAPYEADDAEFFFGRERLVDELVVRLDETPLLAVVGPSGSGKSSLLSAGLLPALEWESARLRPSEPGSVDLVAALDRVPRGGRLVLAVDQFEEVFADSVAEAERRAFVDALVEGAWDPERRALVLIALRADFFGRLASYGELADLVASNHVLLGPMSAAELRHAIEGPCERTGLEVEPELVDALVDAVAGEAGGLPLLSTALLDLWSEREDDTLTLASYQRAEGVGGAVGRHAEAAFRSLDDADREVAKRILLRLTAGGEGEAPTRRRVTRAELDADDDQVVARILAALVEQRLLVADDGRVELVHEALLERWPRLADWLEEDVHGHRLHRHLSRAATEWDATARDPGELYRGARLAATLEWADASGGEARLNRLERDFLDESRTVFAKANRRLRVLLAVALVLLGASLVAGTVAFTARASAKRQATDATAERLGAQALIDPSLDQSLLLAREGVNLDDSLATRSNLLAALLRSPAAIGVAHEGSHRLLDEALSPDGRTLAVRGDDGNVVFFDPRTLRRVGAPLQGSDQIGLYGAVQGPLHALAFSPDGKTLAVAGTGGDGATVVLADARTHKQTAAAFSDESIAADVAFAPDGQTFATGEPTTGTVSPPPAVFVVRDARTGDARALSAPIPAGRLAGYTRDGRFLVVSAGGRRSLLLDARTLGRVRTFPIGGAATTSPVSDTAAFGHPDGTVTLLDLRTGKPTKLAGQASGGIESIAFSADGRMLATGVDDGSVVLWNVAARTLRETFRGHSAAVHGAVFSPDGRTLYTVGYDGSIIAWDVSGSRRLGQPFRFSSAAQVSTWSEVSPSGALFALSPGPNRVTLWRAATHTRFATLRGPVGNVAGLAFNRDGRLVAAVGGPNGVVWNVATGKISRVFPVGHGAAGIAFSPNGHTLAIGRADGVNALYDLRTGKEVGELGAAGSIVDTDFSPDGELLASASLSGTVTVWNVARQMQIRDLPGAVAAYAYASRFSPNGKLLAVGDSSGAVVFWDPSTGKRVGQPLVGHNGGIDSVAFDPSGRTLATVSDDGKIRLWDVATRTLIGAPLPGSTTSGSVSFFPDGRHVLGVFNSGTGVVWNVAPAAWSAKACSVAGRNLTTAEWRDFLVGGRHRRVCP